jgi:hypothetical protein
MPGRKPLAPVAGVEEVRRRLEAWRKTRTTRDLPEEIWEAAVNLAKTYGVSRIAKALALHYNGLKDRVKAASEREGNSPRASQPLFMELDMNSTLPPPTCVVELEDQRGAKMTIRLSASDLDLRALTEAFWNRNQ